MTMFLMNTVQAEVEPVPGRAGWFQLTGKGILRETQDCEDLLNDVRGEGLVEGAKLLGLHDVDEDIEKEDPRFYDDEEPGFGVVQGNDGTYTMYLACNRAEYVLFRFLVPMAGGEKFDVEYDDISNYRK